MKIEVLLPFAKDKKQSKKMHISKWTDNPFYYLWFAVFDSDRERRK